MARPRKRLPLLALCLTLLSVFAGQCNPATGVPEHRPKPYVPTKRCPDCGRPNGTGDLCSDCKSNSGRDDHHTYIYYR